MRRPFTSCSFFSTLNLLLTQSQSSISSWKINKLCRFSAKIILHTWKRSAIFRNNSTTQMMENNSKPTQAFFMFAELGKKFLTELPTNNDPKVNPDTCKHHTNFWLPISAHNSQQEKMKHTKCLFNKNYCPQTCTVTARCGTKWYWII